MPNNPNAVNPFPGPVQPNGFQTIAATCGETAQVNLYSGNMTFRVQVVRVKTIGLPLEFFLTYNSQETVLGPVGNLWRHNYMMGLTFVGSPVTQIILTSSTGRQYKFNPSGSNWVLTADSYFTTGVLSGSGSNWLFTFPNGTVYTFNSSGLLTGMADSHGNSTTLSYSGGNLITITEPTSRTITLGYTGSLLTSITDPRGKTTYLGYDTTHNNLTSITGPTGCVLGYAYATPSNSLITSRTDPNLNSYGFSYTLTSGLWQLTGATDAESPSNSISYAYGTVTETVADTGSPTTMNFYRTTLTDARGHAWEYRFDFSGNLWRTIDPLGHWRVFYNDAQSRPLYQSGGYQFLQGGYAAPRDNPNNVTRGAAWDASGNQVVAYAGDGGVTTADYDTKNELTSLFERQASVAVEGGWVGQYGNDGYVLCAFNNNTADVQALPSYISGITAGPRLHLDEMANAARLQDPRTPLDASSLRRELGFYQATTSFSFSIQMGAAAKTFNLSLYTHSADQGVYSATPLAYYEQFGRKLSISVTDANGTQTRQVTNNAPCWWLTFPVSGAASGTISVTVAAVSPNTDARLGIVAFDPIDSHQTRLTWNTTHDVTGISQMAGSTVLSTAMTYNSDGTRATLTDANTHQTQFSYLDTWKNLTKIHDANGYDWLQSFDANGNRLTFKDPYTNTWTATFDDKNRPLTLTDPLSNVLTLQYDNAGNVVKITDGNGNYTQFQYTKTNRLYKIIDMLSHVTQLAYDASGNLLSLTDPLTRVTQWTWDLAERMTAVQRADGTLVTAAYDTLDRLVALTTPNGNVGTLSAMVLAGAGNLLHNPGAETVDPYTSTLAQDWALGSGASGSRDTTVAYDGQASLKLVSGYFTQAAVPLPPGVTAVMQMWATSNGSSSAASVYGELRPRQFDGSVSPQDTSTTNLPTSSTAWTQTPRFRFNVPSGTNGPSAPGDAQFTRFTTDELRLYRGGTAAAVWLDDIALFALSTALAYDGEDRLKQAQTPDGATVQLVRDRFGRVASLVDARGKATQLQYDSLNRVTAVIDALSNSTSFQWDGVSNLTAVTDGRGYSTRFAYTPVNLLSGITYMDTTTELFSYDHANRLTGYTNNRGQSRTLTWDNANRLTKVAYNTDSTTVQYTLDHVGNVTQRIDRNLDVTNVAYDGIYRVVQVARIPGSGSATHAWVQYLAYDAVGNVTSFSTCTAGNVYDRALYDTDDYVLDPTTWTTPSPGYDAMDRLRAYQDRLGNETDLSYSANGDGWLASLSFPNGVTTTQSCDVVGRLVSSDTAKGGTDILPLVYGYDQASNRVGLVAGNDTFDWGMDAASSRRASTASWSGAWIASTGARWRRSW